MGLEIKEESCSAAAIDDLTLFAYSCNVKRN